MHFKGRVRVPCNYALEVIVEQRRNQDGNWGVGCIVRMNIDMRIGAISFIIHFLFRTSLFLSNLFLLDFVLGSEGSARITTGPNLVLCAIALFFWIFLFRLLSCCLNKKYRFLLILIYISNLLAISLFFFILRAHFLYYFYLCGFFLLFLF